MNVVLLLVVRGLRLYVRDRAGVMFSLLGPVILLGLYALFLGRLQTDAIAASYPLADERDVLVFVMAWVFAGVTMITTLTTGLAALGTFVEDRASGRFVDFLVSPPRRSQLVLGYLGSSLVIAFALSLIVAVVGQLVILALGGPFIGWVEALTLIGYIALSCAAFSAFSALATTFLRTTSAFAALSTVLGTVLGFLAGAYIPAGVLPTAVLNVMNVLPFAASAMLIRQPFTAAAADRMTGGDATAIHELETFYGMRLTVGEVELSNAVAIAELAVLLVVLATLGAWRAGRAIR
ncbi:MAG: ABC transporter permease [Protaetiibacter sp.]